MTATATAPVPSFGTARRLGNVLVAVGAVLVLLSTFLLVRPAGAASTVLVADTAAALALDVSRATVPAGEAGGVILVDEAMPPTTWSAPAALATIPGSGSLLLTSPDALSADVVAEVERVLAPNGTVMVLGMPAVVAAAEARGWTVIAVPVTGALTTSLALADQTFGAPGGTTQRLLVVAAADGAHLVAGAASVHGVNVAIPVLAVGAGESVSLDTVLRERLLVADPAVVADGAVTASGSSVATRLFDADPATVAAQLNALTDADPKDGLLEPRRGRTVIAVERDEARPQPALLAAAVAARDQLDGFDASYVLVDGPADLAALDEGNGATFLGLTRGAPTPPPASTPAPLPVTGGGLVIGAVLIAAGARLRRP